MLRSCGEDRSKLIISLYCPPMDPLRDLKLSILMHVYRTYKNNFTYCIFENELPEEVFPHCNPNYPCFTLFNFFHQHQAGAYKSLFKSKVNSYERFFLNLDSPNAADKAEVIQNLNKFFMRKVQKCYLNTNEENIQELTGVMQKPFFEKF